MSLLSLLSRLIHRFTAPVRKTGQYLSPQRAAHLAIRRDMDLHPADRGEHWR